MQCWLWLLMFFYGFDSLPRMLFVCPSPSDLILWGHLSGLSLYNSKWMRISIAYWSLSLNSRSCHIFSMTSEKSTHKFENTFRRWFRYSYQLEQSTWLRTFPALPFQGISFHTSNPNHFETNFCGRIADVVNKSLVPFRLFETRNESKRSHSITLFILTFHFSHKNKPDFPLMLKNDKMEDK